VFCNQLDHSIEIGIARAEALSEPVPTARRDLLPVDEHVELSEPSSSRCGIDAEARLDEGRETRSLCFVSVSRRAVDDLDLHAFLQLRSALPIDR
jgi:hypothetical protein